MKINSGKSRIDMAKGIGIIFTLLVHSVWFEGNLMKWINSFLRV